MALKVVNETSIDTKVTDAEVVYQGEFVIDNDKLVITFDEDKGFKYDGGNLMLITTILEKGDYGDAFFYGIESTESSMHYNFSATTDNFLPKATFTYEGELAEYDARINKEAIDFGTVPSNNLPRIENVRITNKGANPITPSVSIDGAAFTTTYQQTTLAKNEYVDIPVTFNAEVSENAYTGTMTITAYDGEGGVKTVALSGTVGEPVYEVTVADGTGEESNIPFNTAYWDNVKCMSQVIYKKTDLENLAGKEITRITYYPKDAIALDTDGEATISFGQTSSDKYENETPFDATRTATWKPTTDGSLVVELENPYLYDGKSNLVVDFRVTTKSATFQSPAVKFAGVKGDYTDYVALYRTSGSYYRSSFTPKTTFGYRDAVEPDEYAIEMTPAPGEYDGVQIVTVNATPALPANATLKYTFTEADATDAPTEQDYPATGVKLYKSGIFTFIARNGETELARQEGAYTINLPALAFTMTPEPGTYEGAQDVTIACTNGIEGCELVYDWTYTPTEGDAITGNQDNPTFTAAKTGVLTIIATEANTGRTYETPEGGLAYTITEPAVNYTITLDNAPATYDSNIVVKATVDPELPEGAKLYYTFASTDATPSEKEYKAGVKLISSGTLTFILRDANNEELARTGGEYIVPLYGDLNGDGRVEVGDVNVLVNIILGKYSLDVNN